MLNPKADLVDGRFRVPLCRGWLARPPTPPTAVLRSPTHWSSRSRTSRGTGSRDRRQAWLMCWISPSRCWCWAPDMWSWNSCSRREEGRGMRSEPQNSGQECGPGKRPPTLASCSPHVHWEAVSLTTLCGPEKDGERRHGVSTRQPEPLLPLETERLQGKEQSDQIPGPHDSAQGRHRGTKVTIAIVIIIPV